ncbi:MAG: glycosyltransferase 87 family protein [Chloroflexota bacterium]
MSQSGNNPERPKPAGKPGQTDKTRPTMPAEPNEADETLPELDEGPRPGPVDDIQAALFDAARQGVSTEVEMGDLPSPMPDLDAGPRPAPVDEVQQALFEAARQGAPTEVDFDQLPGPGLTTRPQKVVKFKPRETHPLEPDAPPQPDAAPDTRPLAPDEPPSEPMPLPDFPPPETAAASPDFWLLLALFVAFRVLTLLLLRPGGFIRDWSDFDTYFGIAALSDYSLFPFFDFWLEWPPLLPWLAVAAYKLSLLLPPWPDDPRLWFILLLGGVFVLFEIGNFFLIYRLARRLFEAPATVSRVLWLYAGLFPPVYAMLGFFDGLALFFLLLALDWLLDERRFPSAIAVGVGFMIKIFPVIFLPVALRRLWHQYRQNRAEAGVELGLYAVVTGLTVIVLLAPFLIGGPQWVLASARSMLNRSSWETVWAVAEGYYGFGAVLGDRLNPAETAFAVHENTLPWGLISLAFAGIYAYLLTRPADYSRPRPVVALAGLTVAVFMLYSKGYSPQFLVYLLPFIVLLFPNGRGLIYALIFTALNVLEQPIYFVLLPTATWLLTLVAAIRFGLTVVVGLDFAMLVWPVEERWPPAATLRRRTPHGLGVAGLVLLLILAPILLRTYTAARLPDSPVAAFAGFMQTQARLGEPGKPRLLLSDQATYRQIYPHLNRQFDLQLADGAAKGYAAAPKAADLLQDLATVWVLPTGPQQQALTDAVNQRGQAVASFDFSGLGTATLYSFADASPTPFIAPARFVGGLELLLYEIEKEPGAVNVTLYWRAVDPQAQSYTVFTHLLDAEGQWVTGHDSLPANGAAPTDTWTVNAVQVDPHRLQLPPGLPRGEYTLVVGLHNRFDERLRAIDADGIGFANRAVPLEVIQLP